MVTVHSGYKIEQAVDIVLLTLVMIVQILQVRAEKVWPDGAKVIQQNLHITLFLGSILGLVWCIDPYTFYGVYPWQIVPFLRDLMVPLLLWSAGTWLTEVSNTLFVVSAIPLPTNLALYVRNIPVLLDVFLVIFVDIYRVKTNQNWPSGVLVSYLALLSFSWGLAIVYVILEVRKTGQKVAKAVGEKTKAQRSKVMRRLMTGYLLSWIIVVTAAYFSYQAYTAKSSEYENVFHSPSEYSPWTVQFVWIPVFCTFMYNSWMPLQGNPAPPLPVVSSGNITTKRGSKLTDSSAMLANDELAGSLNLTLRSDGRLSMKSDLADRKPTSELTETRLGPIEEQKI